MLSPKISVCGVKFSVDHAMVCQRGRFIIVKFVPVSEDSSLQHAVFAPLDSGKFTPGDEVDLYSNQPGLLMKKVNQKVKRN